MKSPSSLRNRIRNGTLTLLFLALALGAYALPRVHRLGGAIRETLYRNYISIEAAQHMHAALRELQLAARDGSAAQVLPRASAEFMRWMDIENHDFTEVGEPQLAGYIESRARQLFAALAAQPGRYDGDFDRLHGLLDELVAMNRAAMFRADSRSVQLGKQLTYEFGAGLLILLVAGAAFSWGLGATLSRPLGELAERLRGISLRKTHVRLEPQPLAELDAVAREFNRMAEQLEHYERLNIERLVYEKSKTEAIIESLEDGVVLIDPDGVVTHLNEIAAIIVGIETSDALGSRFDDLSSGHPHYLRIRDAVRNLQKNLPAENRTEVQLHVRGRDHYYVLKLEPLNHTDGNALGTLLVLQDVTYVRDQDRARTNLVGTLSHELRTPMTGLALSAELLHREQDSLTPKQRELVAAIVEECGRMKLLSDNLLNLARGELASISLQREKLDLGSVTEEVISRFRLQAEEKQVALLEHIAPVPQVRGDATKLSWVISNLVGNALRFTPAGGTIEINTRLCPDRGVIRLEVCDSGPGIPPALRASVFQKFTQYGGNGERGSAGLGLAIAREIVEAHAGRIYVESGEHRGSRFVVELPAVAEDLDGTSADRR